MNFGALPDWNVPKEGGFSLCISGSKKSGADELLKILLSHDYYGREMEHHRIIHLYGCETKKNKIIEDLIDDLEAHTLMPPYTLLVLHSLNGIDEGVLTHLFYYHRHFGITVIFRIPCLEYLRCGLRHQISHFILFDPSPSSFLPNNPRNFILDRLLFQRDSEFNSHETKNRELFQKRVKECWDVPCQFLLVDMDKIDLKDRYHVGINKPLFSLEDIAQLIITNERSPLDSKSH